MKFRMAVTRNFNYKQTFFFLTRKGVLHTASRHWSLGSNRCRPLFGAQSRVVRNRGTEEAERGGVTDRYAAMQHSAGSTFSCTPCIIQSSIFGPLQVVVFL